jgi:hypothetical protein
MIRSIVITSAVLAGVLAQAGPRAQQLSPADQQFFDRHIADVVRLEPSPVDNPALPKVFDCRFYRVKVVVAQSSWTLVVARTASDLVQVALPSTASEMPDLQHLVRPAFRLATDEDAHVFQDALDVLYPIDAGFGGRDVAAKTIRHAGTAWTFVRGKFFDHDKGFVVTTDEAGAVTAVKYSLEIQ